MFTFTRFNRRYPYNSELSRYCMESTSRSIIKLSQEERKNKKGVLIKKYFNEYYKNNDDNRDIFIKTISFLSALYFTSYFYFNMK
jgi:hypothetical protein